MTVATLPPGIRRHRGKYQVRYYGSDGRERARSFARLTDAKTFKASVTTDKARGEWHDSRLGRVRLSEYARQWAETKGNVNERTRINIEGRLRNHITPTFGTSPLSSIEPQDVRSWITDLKARGLAPSTVRATYRTFGQIMRTAEVDGLIRRSPCVGVELPAETSHDEMHFLTEEQVVRLAEAISARYRCAILMDAYTGLRAGELWALTLQRVDMLRGVVDVAESLSEVRGALVTGPTKTRARRSVTLPRFLVETIGEHLAEFPSSAYLFTSADGGRSGIATSCAVTSSEPFETLDCLRAFASMTCATPAPPSSSGRIGTPSRSSSASAIARSGRPSIGTGICSRAMTHGYSRVSTTASERRACGPMRTKSGPRVIPLPSWTRVGAPNEAPDLRFHSERATGFEPATLTLAR
ncbi:MAG: tyrosine-type recombinase/integrase, partial [Actinobacteria bacterium]|nr:tyrosine-type recombinase/integrase [Actinomycetota bacterium]